MITAILPTLSIGDLDACRQLSVAPYRSVWTVVHACKEPCHRQALGYSGRALAPDHPGYLSHETREPDALYLNLVDVADPRFFSVPLLARALDYIDARYKAATRAQDASWKQLLIHCNQGKSRAAGLALLYLYTRLQLAPTYAEARALFSSLYPAYEPGKGLDGHLSEKWPEYAMDGFRKGAVLFDPTLHASFLSIRSDPLSPPPDRKHSLYGQS